MRSILKMKILISFFTIIAITPVVSQNSNNTWRQELKEQLQLHGHRNWILIVDAAYPFQSKPAIKTIATGEKQLDVVRRF